VPITGIDKAIKNLFVENNAERKVADARDLLGLRDHAGIDDLMAELAVLCHWSPAEMEAMDVIELIDWHARVVAVHDRINGGE
jgi:hypothetical protein